MSQGCRQTLWKINPHSELTGLLESLEMKLARKGDMEQVFFLIIFPRRCSFLPFGVGISSFRKVKVSVFSCTAHMRPECKALSLWKDFLGGKKALVGIFSCLGFKIAHEKRIVMAHRRCFTDLFFFSKRDFFVCFDSLEFVSLRVFLDPCKRP